MAIRYTIESDYLGDFTEDEHKVMSLKILYPKLKRKEIANMLGMTTQKVGRIMNSPKFIQEYNIRIETPIKILESIKRDAALKLKEIIYKGKSETAVINAVKMVLNNEIFGVNKDVEETNIDFTGWDNDN